MQTSFKAMQLSTEVIEGLALQHITTPTPIQVLTYPAFLEGSDLVVESYTGSGKTLAFLLPLFRKINLEQKSSQAIILAPTHELAHQIHEQIKLLARNAHLPVSSALLLGEVHIDKQILKLREKPHILVGSPGRILDLLLKKKIDCSTIQTIILDEADNLLESTQNTTVKKLLYQLGDRAQIALFSATITDAVRKIALPFLKEPCFLQTAPQTTINPHLEHYYIKAQARDKFEMLRKLLQAAQTSRVLVFVSQHTDTQALVEKLRYHHFSVATLSGKLSKEERANALRSFKSGKVNILLSSDLSARGLDVPHITHIVHYDVPLTAQDYLHRSGRSARKGERGLSISLLTPRDLGLLGILKRTYKISPEELLLVKGGMKNLSTQAFIEQPASMAPVPVATPSGKKRNKYPKGYTSGHQTPTQLASKAEKLSKPAAAAPISEEEFLASGTLADALKLIEEAGFTKDME